MSKTVQERVLNPHTNVNVIPLPPLDFLREIFYIDESIPQGLRWKARPENHFQTKQGYVLFSSRMPGMPAGGLCGKYYRLSLKFRIGETWFSEQIHNHRIIWALHNGKDPLLNLVDHEDINGLNNSAHNLRLANVVQSSQNRRRRSDNITGVVGVGFRKDLGRWRARITVSKKLIHLGDFDTIIEAQAARREAEVKFFGIFAPSEK